MKALFILFISCCLISCKKDWLDAKPNISLVIPSEIGDYQKLLDNSAVFNLTQPGLGEISSDDYYISTNSWLALSSTPQKNAYIWASNIYEGDNTMIDWRGPYQQVFNANVVLEGIKDVPKTASTEKDWNNVYGSALFHRAFAYYSLAQVFTKQFDSATSTSDLGVPLRLTSDVKLNIPRSTVYQTYQQVISDLQGSLPYLPIIPLYKTRPSKCASYALLAKIFLTAGDYDEALKYSDSALQLNNSLIDYNAIDSSSTYPLPKLFDNAETIFHTRFSYEILRPNILIVDSSIYNSYVENDLRKSLFFINKSGAIRYRGSYDHSMYLFGGIANDELFLIRAECYARKGSTESALNDLNTLLKNRWVTEKFTPIASADAADALKIILIERRKELIFRGLRWIDLRRLNKDSRFVTTLHKTINGQQYILLPNDTKYVLPIPQDEIDISKIQQNNR